MSVRHSFKAQVYYGEKETKRPYIYGACILHDSLSDVSMALQSLTDSKCGL